MKSPANRAQGIIAILDALGAAQYGDDDVQHFMESRQGVLDLLNQKIEDTIGAISRDKFDIFTFNDTVVIAFRTEAEPEPGQLVAFFQILRKFFVDSMAKGILLRGAISIGTFFVDASSNTIMGQAVTDAAAWYDKANWMGIAATPKASIFIRRYMDKKINWRRTIVEYNVPLHEGTLSTLAVNWPRIFFTTNLTPCGPDEKPRQKVFELLSKHTIPLGTEAKYANSIAFFEHAAALLKAERKKTV